MLFSVSDLNPLFNWNVKQLFLYITAEYKTENNVSLYLYILMIFSMYIIEKFFTRNEILI